MASFSASVTGSYTATVTDHNGCTGTGSGTLTTNAAPVIVNLTLTNLSYMLGRPPSPLAGSASMGFSGPVPTDYFSGKKLRVAFTESQDKDHVSVRSSGTNQLFVVLNADGSGNITNSGVYIGTCTGGTPTQALVVTFGSNALTNHVQVVLTNISF